MSVNTKSKRILWIFAHTTLRHFEMPILQNMGYEIYCPKKYTIEAGDLSASITYDYDSTLSIPKEDIEYLNSVDFFAELSIKTISVINKYFGIAFVMLCRESLRSLILGFKGAIVLHVFGLCGEGAYGNVLFDLLGQQLYLEVRKLGSRFWFSYTYENMIDIEPDILKTRGIYMPIGIKETVNKEWTGGDARILFVSPEINSNEYYHKVYKNFKDNFGDIPHVIGGAQIIDVVNDDTVTGFLSREEYDYNMTSLCGMFYHSQEPRHIHYHPIEAMRNGMPVLFMAGGMLDYMGGKKLPGRCLDVNDARRKMKLLLKGDRGFIKKVISSQSIILKYFTTDYCLPYWEDSMKKIESSANINYSLDMKSKKRVAVILPAEYTGGVLDYAIRFAMVLKKYSQIFNDEIEIVFAHLESKKYDEQTFKILKDNNVQLRKFWIEINDGQWVNDTYDFLGINPDLIKLDSDSKVTTYCDGMANFRDCDYCFIMSDSFSYPLFLLTPYAIVVHDYIQRYVPHMMSREVIYAKAKSQRNADYVITTSKPTYDDAINYACIAPEKLILTPPLFFINSDNTNEKSRYESNDNYFIWSTNCAEHKNHLLVLDALQEYFSNGGKMKCIITGSDTDAFKEKEDIRQYAVNQEYVLNVKERIKDLNKDNIRIKIKGRLNKTEYYETLSYAKFVVLPQYADNGNFTAIDAASLGIPSVCSDYPAQRYMNDYCGLDAVYFDPFSKASLVDALFLMEREYQNYSDKNPNMEKLTQYDYMVQGEELYKKLKCIMKI